MKYNVRRPANQMVDYTTTYISELELDKNSLNSGADFYIKNDINNYLYRIGSTSIYRNSSPSGNLNVRRQYYPLTIGFNGTKWVCDSNVTPDIGDIIVIKGNNSRNAFHIFNTDAANKLIVSTTFYVNDDVYVLVAKKFDPDGGNDTIYVQGSSLVAYIYDIQHKTVAGTEIYYYCIYPFAARGGTYSGV